MLFLGLQKSTSYSNLYHMKKDSAHYAKLLCFFQHTDRHCLWYPGHMSIIFYAFIWVFRQFLLGFHSLNSPLPNKRSALYQITRFFQVRFMLIFFFFPLWVKHRVNWFLDKKFHTVMSKKHYYRVFWENYNYFEFKIINVFFIYCMQIKSISMYAFKLFYVTNFEVLHIDDWINKKNDKINFSPNEFQS